MPILLPEVWHIEHFKLAGYLLNLDHSHGSAKARAFLGYGFAADQPECLAEALFEHVGAMPYRRVVAPAGARLVFEGALRAPLGVIPRVRSVWLPDTDEPSARLLTAYPFDEC